MTSTKTYRVPTNPLAEWLDRAALTIVCDVYETWESMGRLRSEPCVTVAYLHGDMEQGRFPRGLEDMRRVKRGKAVTAATKRLTRCGAFIRTTGQGTSGRDAKAFEPGPAAASVLADLNQRAAVRDAADRATRAAIEAADDLASGTLIEWVDEVDAEGRPVRVTIRDAAWSEDGLIAALESHWGGQVDHVDAGDVSETAGTDYVDVAITWVTHDEPAPVPPTMSPKVARLVDRIATANGAQAFDRGAKMTTLFAREIPAGGRARFRAAEATITAALRVGVIGYENAGIATLFTVTPAADVAATAAAYRKACADLEAAVAANPANIGAGNASEAMDQWQDPNYGTRADAIAAYEQNAWDTAHELGNDLDGCSAAVAAFHRTLEEAGFAAEEGASFNPSTGRFDVPAAPAERVATMSRRTASLIDAFNQAVTGDTDAD